MKFRIAALSALACVTSACATAISPYQALPVDARSKITATDIVVPVKQSEIYIFTPPSQIAAYGGGGLLLALIDAGVDSSNAGTAEEAVKPLRNAMVDFNFDEVMKAELKTALDASPWLKAGNYQVVKEVTDANLDRILEASTSSAVLFVTMDYNLNWSSDSVTVNMTPHLFPKGADLTTLVTEPAKSGPKTSSVNALYRNAISFRDRAPNATETRETNLVAWSADNAAVMRATLKRGAAKLTELLVSDLHDPLAMIDEKTTKLPKMTIDGATGYVVKSDDAGSLVQFATGTKMYVTKAAQGPLPKPPVDPKKKKLSTYQ